jgi:hypothetical protein
MKSLILTLLLTVSAVCISGCSSYQYRIVQPSNAAGVIGKEPAIVNYEPLQYRLSPQSERLALHITNPTDDRISLLADRSYAVDPRGESHPIRGKVIAPHSFTEMTVPPVPVTYTYYAGWGPGWGPGWGWAWGWGSAWHGPYWDPFWGGMYAPPSFYQPFTSYDWEWKNGPVRLRFSYEREGKLFEHDFEFVREKPPKK